MSTSIHAFSWCQREFKRPFYQPNPTGYREYKETSNITSRRPSVREGSTRSQTEFLHVYSPQRKKKCQQGLLCVTGARESGHDPTIFTFPYLEHFGFQRKYVLDSYGQCRVWTVELEIGIFFNKLKKWICRLRFVRIPGPVPQTTKTFIWYRSTWFVKSYDPKYRLIG